VFHHHNRHGTYLLVFEYKLLEAHLRHLESEGRLLNDTQWRMDHVDAQGHTVGEILSDARHNHIARLDSKFEQWQAKEAANAVHPTPTPESMA
jgi:hypothetical protein